MNIVKDDFEQVTWEEYDAAALKIAEDIGSFCKRFNLQIDCIIPILRGGGVLAIHLSHLLGIIPICSCQYKYRKIGEVYKPECISDADFSNIPLQNNCFLVVEGNHASGRTAQIVIEKIILSVPDAKIIYCSLSRDAAYLSPLNGTLHEIYGMLSNESRKYSENYCSKNGIRYKLTVFPWESIDEEFNEIIEGGEQYYMIK